MIGIDVMAYANINNMRNLGLLRKKLPQMAGIFISIFLGCLLLIGCSTTRFSHTSMVKDVSDGKLDKYTRALNDDIDVVMLIDCARGRCIEIDEEGIPKGRYREVTLIPKQYRDFLEATKKCENLRKERNELFLDQSVTPPVLNAKILALSDKELSVGDQHRRRRALERANSRPYEALQKYDRSMEDACNCRVVNCQFHLYDKHSDADWRQITHLLGLNQERLAREAADDRKAQSEADSKALKERQMNSSYRKIRALMEKALKKQHRNVASALLCRDDQPIKLLDILDSQIMACAAGQGKNASTIHRSEEFYHLVSVECERVGTNTIFPNKILFRTSRDMQVYSFSAKYEQSCLQ